MTQGKRKQIKLLGPSSNQDELNAVVNVLQSGWWGLGPVTETLEKEFAEFAGAKYAVALNSATSALHLAVRMVGKKGKIIVPALTFVSTAIAGLYEDCEIVFADIDEQTYCLDPNDVRRKIDGQTIAVIPVHYAGKLADIDYSRKIPVIEDCAHAAGTRNAGRKGIMACWSFHPVKNIASGDGGMITTDDEQLAKKLMKLRWLGIDTSTHDRAGKKGYQWEYSISEIGYKYHTNDIMAAVQLAQLKKVTAMNKKRQAIAKRYTAELAHIPIILPPESGNWHLYVIRVEKKYRNKLIDFLKKQNIASGVHYKPLYYYPIFQWDITKTGKTLPVTEKIWQEIISLPIYPDLTESDQSRVIEALRSFFTSSRL